MNKEYCAFLNSISNTNVFVLVSEMENWPGRHLLMNIDLTSTRSISGSRHLARINQILAQECSTLKKIWYQSTKIPSCRNRPICEKCVKCSTLMCWQVMVGHGWLDTLSIAPLSAVTQALAQPPLCSICSKTAVLCAVCSVYYTECFCASIVCSL